ncbi:hypothetical protein LEP1GSC008_1224 [Leptospira kirschneri serovar Bulgarica str. Nikolaevo]|uniref:Uncharacterized protein n=2 Tax=Leptospira kirschneri TaxID=29507 RepID=A0A0E2B7U2_9LEPT|nr:hypothetical protein LEP1GSC081_2392 [Leptospira kirschneri str. H1]EMJ91401.1 hypothetical protein LEP1GSC198_0097 [Leptospira kirschneri str. JB]EMK20807.1 hypothetical protein LEP1GSC008_1224 [Leptospira kirschneri serovar Bulgarica str. Nikolaevo]
MKRKNISIHFVGFYQRKSNAIQMIVPALKLVHFTKDLFRQKF